MPSRMLPLIDPAITHGMNTVDDPKLLKPGECVRLLNAFPGNPPIPRNGCTGKLLSGTTVNYRFLPPGIAFNYTSGGTSTVYVVVWVYEGTSSTVKALAINVSTGAFTDLGAATFVSTDLGDYFFDLLDIHSCIYSCVSQTMASWKSAALALGHKVFESNAIIRDMCISIAAAVTGLTKADSGGAVEKGFYSYAFQYVRRNDTAAWEAGGAITGIIIPAGITVTHKPKRIDTFLPGTCIGIEVVANRKPIEVTDAGNNSMVTINTTGTHGTAMAQGATHIRVSRSSKQDTQALADGATHKFLADLPLLDAVGTTYTDIVSDAAMNGEENQLITGYSVAPPAAFIEYVKGRLFLMAVDGRVYFSETVGGDGGTVLSTAQAYPQAWASLFKPTEYFLDCDYIDGQKATGMKRLGEDLFLFKERKMFAIFGGSPTDTPLSQVSNVSGCAFPYTITKCEIKGMFGKCLLFMGNDGPMVMEEGGRLRPFSEFKIKELWPDKSTELYSELDANYDWITHNCTAAFFKNTWWVLYQTHAGTNKVFGYYFDPDLGSGEDAPRGPLEFQFAEM